MWLGGTGVVRWDRCGQCLIGGVSQSDASCAGQGSWCAGGTQPLELLAAFSKVTTHITRVRGQCRVALCVCACVCMHARTCDVHVCVF